MLRPFQEKLKNDIYKAWEEGADVVMPVAPTGAGKTVVLSSIISDIGGYNVAIAHRQELVSQISTALARNGLRHKVITNNKTLIRTISAIHMAEFGRSYVDHSSKLAVAGVDTLGRLDASDQIFAQTRHVTIDEGHHVLRDNKWGKVWKKFKSTKGLLPTATPLRADGRGLGAHADGIVNALVLAPTMRDIINMGYLTDYRIYCPPNNLKFDDLKIGAAGDFSPQDRAKRIADSNIVGDVVQHYIKIAKGKLGVTFADNIKSAHTITQAFLAAGIPAQLVTSETPDEIRAAIGRKFQNREILQLVNVDLFGEGYDLPALEVVSFARATASFSLYCQQFGRVLRLFLPKEHAPHWHTYSDSQRKAIIASSTKPNGIVIDHVSNVIRHKGPPDRPVIWTLDRQDKQARSKSDAIPYKVCTKCVQPFERVHKDCPHCGHYEPPKERSSAQQVDGDLTELDPIILSAMRGEIARIDGNFYPPQGLPFPAQVAAKNRHYERQLAQKDLRNSIAWWAGVEQLQGRTETESYRRFYFKFGIDIASAQALGKPDATDLMLRINEQLAKLGIDGTVNHEEFIK
jgi:superfamily II DNA or RNA helicase